MSKILVFGASGQLGSCLKKVAAERSLSDISFPDESIANILNKDALEILFNKEEPEFVINCAAYTAVDKAEDDVEIARKVNREGPANLAFLCESYNSTLIHVSTDFVFNGADPKLLNEDDDTEPISIYGMTKLEGEQEIAKLCSAYFIVRTSWLYSEFGNNFVKTMQKLGTEREELSVIVDQVGTPTYAIDLASSILDITASGSKDYGIYHFSNEGAISWYDFAHAIFEVSGISVNLNPIPTSQYVTRAKRPAFAVMDKSKIKRNFGINIKHWRESLEVCIENLKSIS